MEKNYEYFDVTADVGFHAYGKDINEAFENAALAMFNVITNTDNVDNQKTYDFSLQSEDNVSLLFDFLEELLFLHEVEFMLFSNFNVAIDKDLNLKATVQGEDIDWEKHERGSEVKAITFHKMDVEKSKDLCKVQVILDL